MITAATAGGLSGAGIIIPVMLIFLQMDMQDAVPISTCIGSCSAIFRFIINFNKKHPNRPERNLVNYELVTLVLPLVFVGGLLGVMGGPLIGNTAQMCIFGVVVSWSIYTSG